MARQVIRNLFAQVIDGNGEVATTERKRIIDNSSLLRAVFGRCAAEREIGSAIQAVGRYRQMQKRLRQLLMPQAAIQRRSRVGISIVGKTIVAIVKVATRVTKMHRVARSVGNVSVIREAIAEHDNLGKDRSLCLKRPARQNEQY